MSHHNYRNIAVLEKKMRSHQNMSYALIGGLVTCIACAVLWALTTIISGYQFSIIAVVIGLVVGFGVRYFGAGYDPIYGVIGGGYALLACLLGNLFSQIGFSMSEEGLTLMQILSMLNISNIAETMTASFDLFDLVLYGFAVFAGIRSSRRVLEPGTDPALSLEPTLSSLRAPLVGTIIFTLIGTLCYLALKSPSVMTYQYPSGEKMSQGAYSSGLEHGPWEYYYINGQMQAAGDYEYGLQIGDWEHYHENGQLSIAQGWKDGLQQGDYRSYYDDGQLLMVASYEKDRLEGQSAVYHENGQLASEGEYARDRQVGAWKYYNDNGTLQSEGTYQDGVEYGKWQYYWSDGEISEIQQWDEDGESKIIDAWDENGTQVVTNGTGAYSVMDEENNTRSVGSVLDGSPVGVWKQYRADQLIEEGEYKAGQYRLLNVWTDGQQSIKGGNGTYNSYYAISGDLEETGRIVNGLREGTWTIYYDSLNIPMVESEYSEGVIDGKVVVYDEFGDETYDMQYQNDLPHGPCVWYHGEGMIASTVNFVNGNKQGVQKFWNGSGVLTKEETYEDGVLVTEE